MAVISYFPISLPPEAREGFEKTWKSRIGAVDTFLGFISTELVALADRGEYVVLSRFKDEASFEAWTTSDNFTAGHRGESYAQLQGQPVPQVAQALRSPRLAKS